jgi:hypothetical protein
MSDKTLQFYAIGKSCRELLAFDEFDSKGSGQYYTNDPFFADRFESRSSVVMAYERKKQEAVYIVTITTVLDYNKEDDICKEKLIKDVSLMWDENEIQERYENQS